MKRFSKLVLWVLLIELVISFAIGARLRNQIESPVTYLGLSVAPQPLHVG